MKLKIGISMISVLILLFVSACGSGESKTSGNNGSGSEGESYTLKLGTALTEGDPIYDGLVEFSEAVKERTNGKVTIEIFGSGSLGEDNDIVEQAKTGANVAVLVDSGRLADMVPEIGVLSAPYIVDNFDEANKVAQSDLFKEWSDKLANEHNLQILSFNWYQGERHMLTNKEIKTPEDLEGLKIRTIGAPIAQKTMKALGMSPSGIAWTEVYPGLQQGVIDAAEAQHPATYGANLHEVVDYITKTRHFQLITGIVAGADWMENLPQEYQDIIYEEAQKHGEQASRKTEKSLEEYEQKMIDEGVTVNEVDVEEFKALTDSVYSEFDGYQELRNEINNILGK
ncbi:tripartite ATP-independent transporter solute receptor, DctP family [Salinibacillus kushneri]|uniref:Tripartite ATP-independent transporter solute receptor, DctP family n=1 Tax=Salinibacillus kushneri TaxID=237682 RepID=A0A1I0C9I0_9BACI|nr:C4-dicarboxylate TRAP transporter substrate-binding protein [Salinibacillus kushneri]SET15906.1 tripartite ATP-independent transporter solute receptor, DctP family [Salinibacillus kushneri]